MAISRDRVVLTAPQPQSTIKGWRIDSEVTVDLGTRRVTGTRTWYNQAGAFIRSAAFSARINQAKRDDLAAAIENDIITSDPASAGVASVETVNDIDDPLINP